MRTYEVFYDDKDQKYKLIVRADYGADYFHLHSDYENKETALEVKYALENKQYQDHRQ